MKKINVVLPVYNEVEVIGKFNAELQRVIGTLPQYRFEVIYVLDKCYDGTLDELRKIAREYDNVKVIALSRRLIHTC